MGRFISILKELWSLNLVLTIYYNIKIFGLKYGLKFPLFIYRGCKMPGIRRNCIEIRTPHKPGLIRIGTILTQLSDSKTIVSVGSGKLVFMGSCIVGRGSCIFLDNNAIIEIGKSFSCSGNLRLISCEKISIGEDCMFSWDVTILDSDNHPIFDENGIRLNPSKSVHIGNHVWLGCNVTILKGCHIADNSVVAACTCVTTNCKTPNAIYLNANSKVQSIRENINWAKDYS